MRKIVSIEHVEERSTSNGKIYYRTYAILDDGTEAVGYGKDFDLQDRVEVFHDPKWDVIKMVKYTIDK